MNEFNSKNESFFNIVDAPFNDIPSNTDLSQDVLSNQSDRPCYVIGKNDESASLINLGKIDGLVDDYETDSSIWNNVPIVNRSEIPKDAIIVNCSTSISPIKVHKIFQSSGFKNIVSFYEVWHLAKDVLSPPWFVEEMRKDYKNNKMKWSKVYNMLSDQESRKTLTDIIRYRLTANINYMKEYNVRLKDQYFESVMQFNNEVFVDAGGFDGDTTIEFCKRYPDYKKVFFFEPSPKNMKMAINNTKNLQNVNYFQVGLSDKTEKLSFNPNDGPASAVNNSSKEIINVSTLDVLISEPVSFIKMDLEGWEQKALIGCREHILNDNPKLAISVYHRSQDFYEIPAYILSLNPNYQIYLRHYTQGWSETIMYFLPKK